MISVAVDTDQISPLQSQMASVNATVIGLEVPALLLHRENVVNTVTVGVVPAGKVPG